MATSVDHHYLLRYGSFFASSFVSGLGTAISSSGSQSSTGSGGTVVTHDPLDSKEKLLVALGNVGTQWGSQVKQVFNTPPTVKVARVQVLVCYSCLT